MTLSVKAGIAVQHLAAAALFARMAGGIETRHRNGSPSDQDRAEHRSCVIAAILCAVAFLEGAVNELFSYAVDGNTEMFPKTERGGPEAMAVFWADIERTGVSILTKYELAVSLGQLGSVSVGKGGAEYQSARALVKLRNALVHFKPEWDTALNEHAKLEVELKGKFAEDPFANAGDVFFPKRCLGHGCAAWAVDVARGFYLHSMKLGGFRPRNVTGPVYLPRSV